MTAPRSTVPTLFALAALVAPLPAQQSASDTAQLHPVVVTATRVPMAQATSTISTTVLTGDDLRARGITTVQEALENVPGLYVPRSGSYGAQTSLFVRGGQSDYTQVMIDGVSINDPGGAINLANLTTDNIDRIEIVRGPASVLYGANAVTGVVQIFTRSGRAHPELTVSERGGTYGTSDFEGTLRGGSDRASASLSAARHRTDGIYAFNSQSRNDVFSGALHLAPDTRSTVRLALRYGDAGAHIPTDAYGAPVDSNQVYVERRWIGSLDAGRFLTDRLEARVLLGATNANVRSADFPDTPSEACDFCYDSRTTTYRRSGDVRVNLYATPNIVLTGGGSYERQSQHATGADPAARHVTAYYAQAVGSARNAFSYTLGARVDDNSAFGTFTTYRVSTGYRWPEGTSIHASVGTAFKEPTFDQTSSTSPFARGNPDLHPERTRSWEAGIAQEIARGAFTLSATYFSQRFRDLIQYDPAPPVEGAPNYINIAAANASGVELAAHLAPSRLWNVGASYTWLDTKVTNAGLDGGPGATFVNGAPLIRRPANTVHLTAGVAPSSWSSLHLDVGYIGRRDDIDFANFVRVQTPAYTTVNLAADVDLFTLGTSAVALTARADNLFAERYQEIFGFAAPGRVLLVGGRLTVRE
jgi:vitamin B12 transporter